MEIINILTKNVISCDENKVMHNIAYKRKKQVVTIYDGRRFGVEEYEEHIRNTNLMINTLKKNLTKSFIKEQIDLFEKKLLFLNLLYIKKPVVFLRFENNIKYYYENNGLDVKITKRMFYGKKADEKYPNRFIAENIKIVPLIFSDWCQAINFIKECIYEINGHEIKELINVYNVIHEFPIVNTEKIHHCISDKMDDKEKNNVLNDIAHQIFGSHAYNTQEMDVVRKDEMVKSIVQIPLDFDISIIKNKKAYHMKNERPKNKHKESIIENLLNNKFFLPYSITETHNGEQAYIALDKRYKICDENNGKIRKSNDWLTKEGYKNLIEVLIEFINKNIDKHIDCNVKHITQIMRQDMCLHYKKDNKSITMNKIVYVAEKEECNKYSPEKLLDIIEKECIHKNQMLLAKKAATAKQLLRRNLLLKNLIKDDKKQKIIRKIAKKHRSMDCINNLSHDDFRLLVDSVREHEGYSDYLTDKFMSNKKLMDELNKFPIELYLDKNENNEILDNNNSFCAPISIFRKNECRILSDTGSNTNVNVLNLFAGIAKLSNKDFLKFVRESLDINYSYDGEGERLTQTAKKLDWNIKRIENVLKNRKGKEKKYFTLALKYLDFLKNAVIENIDYRYNQLFKKDYVIMNYNLLSEFVKTKTNRNTKFHNNDIGYIIIKSLAMLGIIEIFKGNRDVKYMFSGGATSKQCTVLKFNELSEKTLIENMKKIIEKEENAHNKSVSIFTSTFKFKFLEKKYGELAISCQSKLVKEKMFSSLGLEARYCEEKTEIDQLNLYERNICTKIRYIILGSFAKHISFKNMTKDQLMQLYKTYQTWSIRCLQLNNIRNMSIAIKNIATFVYNIFSETMQVFLDKKIKPKIDYSNWVYKSNIGTRSINKNNCKKIIRELYTNKKIKEYDNFIKNVCPIPLEFTKIHNNFELCV